MNKVLKMLLSSFMKPMSVSGLVYGLGIVSSTTIPPGDLITVLAVRYNEFLLF